MARANLPPDAYVKARLTFDDHMTLTPASGGGEAENGEATIDDRVGIHENHHTTLTVDCATTAAPGEEASVVLDFGPSKLHVRERQGAPEHSARRR